MKKLSIDDVAKKAGVSISTVSRVMNTPELVKEETRCKVEKVISEHSYIPLSNARNLSKKVSTTLCLIVPEIDNPFCSSIVKGITDIASLNNLSCMCFSSEENVQTEMRLLEKINQIHIAGLVLMPCLDYKEDQLGKRFKKLTALLDAPVVLIDRRADYLNLPGVYFDDASAMYEATKHLILKGHKKIALISGRKHVRQTTDREYGFLLAMHEAGFIKPEKSVFYPGYNLDLAYKEAKKVLKSSNPPTAIIGMNNTITIGIIRAIGEAGLKIGEDIDLVGLDCIEVLRYIGAKIAFIQRDPVFLGEAAAKLLLSKLDDKTRGVAQIQEAEIPKSDLMTPSISAAALTYSELPQDSYLYSAKVLLPENKKEATEPII